MKKVVILTLTIVNKFIIMAKRSRERHLDSLEKSRSWSSAHDWKSCNR